MAPSGDSFEIPELGFSVEMRKTRAETGGELLEFDIVGRPQGFITRPHRHLYSLERYEVLEGSLRLVVDGRERLLGPGETATTPIGAAHAQLPGPGDAPGRVRYQLQPAGLIQEFLERLAEMSRRGALTRSGYPKPVAAAELIRDYSGDSHGTDLPLGVQRAISRAVLAATRAPRAR